MEDLLKTRSVVYIFVIVFINLNGFTNAACQRGLVNYGASCYFIGKTAISFADAMVVCQQINSNLVEIESADENTFIVNTLKNTTISIAPHGFWIGLTDIEVANEWKWIGSGKAVKYSNWQPGQPELRQSENCGILWSSTGFTWHDDFCSDIQAFFVCEKESDQKQG